MAVELRNRFPRTGLTELAATDPELWAKESHEIATKIAYQNGALRGTPKGKRRGCREVTDAAVLPNGYATVARKIADRRMILAGPWWWDVLENGPSSRYAAYFDVEWDPPESRLRNTILLPVLGDHYGRVLERGMFPGDLGCSRL